MENLNLKVTPGKRKRSDSCRSISNERVSNNKLARVESAKERFLRRRRSQMMCFKKRRNTINGQTFKFFYGGSIADPLNLNGLINRTELSNTVTPIASPMITPLRGDVLLPIFQYANINDPLNLGGEYPDSLLNVKPKGRARKRRYSYRKHNKAKEKDAVTEENNISTNIFKKAEEDASRSAFVSDCENTTQLSDGGKHVSSDVILEQNEATTMDKKHEANVSKVVDSKKDAERPNSSKSRNRRSKQPPIIKHKTKNALFKFGNQSSYVGYCNLKNCDARVDLVASEDLNGKSVLDIGCNVGNVTIMIARDHNPRRIVGIDIDQHLIQVAKKNLSYFSNLKSTNQPSCPSSMKTFYGPLASHPLLELDGCLNDSTFPLNIEFKMDDYVPLSYLEAKKQKPEFDVIVAFRITKFIQLNHGDEGLKKTFIKIFHHLKPGGKLYLQAQDWDSYKEKKKLTGDIFNTYKSINFFPSHFKDFLLSSEVGFSECHHMADIQLYNRPKGTKQSILKFVKPSSI